MYWDKILKEVMDKKNAATKFRFTNLESAMANNTQVACQEVAHPSRIANRRSYNLGAKYEGIYFTQREAECMLLLLNGKTISKTADTLCLSPRTIEFYLKNMKTKLGCRTKFELIELVLDSDFLQDINLAIQR